MRKLDKKELIGPIVNLLSDVYDDKMNRHESVAYTLIQFLDEVGALDLNDSKSTTSISTSIK